MRQEGHIEIIFGPMFSGKSTELLRKVRRFQHAKKKCLVINYQHDNRYSSDSVMATHDKVTKKAAKTSKLYDLQQGAKNFDVIAIDEGQFFPDIVEFCQQMANEGIIVIVAALDGTFQRKGFGNILNLLPIAEKISKLTAVCVYCSSQAAFTQRVIESQEIQLVGGQESYKPVCRKCFFSKDRKRQHESTGKKKSVCSSLDSEKKEGQSCPSQDSEQKKQFLQEDKQTLEVKC